LKNNEFNIKIKTMKKKIQTIIFLLTLFFVFKPLLIFFVPGILLLFIYKKDFVELLTLIIGV